MSSSFRYYVNSPPVADLCSVALLRRQLCGQLQQERQPKHNKAGHGPVWP